LEIDSFLTLYDDVGTCYAVNLSSSPRTYHLKVTSYDTTKQQDQ
jgi:hypothetical protein